MPYFNYSIHAREAGAASFWQRREFLHAWWALYRDDGRWTPPEYTRLRRELDPHHNEHLVRLSATLIHVDALHRTGLRRSRNEQGEIPLTSVLERPLAAAVAVIDPRRVGRTAHLALLHLAYDDEAFDRLYDHLVETLSVEGYRRVVGPIGLSPHLGSGLQVDGWDEWPPLHTPSNPPYLPELIEHRLRPLQTGRLYHADVPREPVVLSSGPAVVRPFDPARLSADLLPLLVAATENPIAGFPPPDAAEAAFLLRLLRPKMLTGHLAEVDNLPVGFVLLSPDTAGRLRTARGGRPLWGRALLNLETRFFERNPVLRNRVSKGRLYFGAVLPSWRRQGIGRQLWEHALAEGRRHDWQALTVGPLWLPKEGASPASAFLDSRAAVARQTYRLYERSF